MDYTGIDYVTFRLRSFTSPQSVIVEFLGLDMNSFIITGGRYGYKAGYCHGHINVYYNGRAEMGICVEMSGQGCKEYVTQRNDAFSILKLFYRISDEDTVTRVDIAFDDLGSQQLEFQSLKGKTDRGEVRSKLRSRHETIDNGGMTGHTLYFGSRKSEYYIRIYDKAAEQEQYGKHWIRVEQVFRHKEAGMFIAFWLEKAGAYEAIEDKLQCLFKIAAGVLMKKLAFIQNRENNSSRCIVCDWWKLFLHDAPPVIIPRATVSPTVERAKKWVEKSVAPTLGALMLILGEEWTHKLLWRSISMCGLAGSKYYVLADLWKASGEDPAYEWDGKVMSLSLHALAEEIRQKIK